MSRVLILSPQRTFNENIQIFNGSWVIWHHCICLCHKDKFSKVSKKPASSIPGGGLGPSYVFAKGTKHRPRLPGSKCISYSIISGFMLTNGYYLNVCLYYYTQFCIAKSERGFVGWSLLPFFSVHIERSHFLPHLCVLYPIMPAESVPIRFPLLLLFIFNGHIKIVYIYGAECDNSTHVYHAEWSNQGNSHFFLLKRLPFLCAGELWTLFSSSSNRACVIGNFDHSTVLQNTRIHSFCATAFWYL